MAKQRKQSKLVYSTFLLLSSPPSSAAQYTLLYNKLKNVIKRNTIRTEVDDWISLFIVCLILSMMFLKGSITLNRSRHRKTVGVFVCTGEIDRKQDQNILDDTAALDEEETSFFYGNWLLRLQRMSKVGEQFDQINNRFGDQPFLSYDSKPCSDVCLGHFTSIGLSERLFLRKSFPKPIWRTMYDQFFVWGCFFFLPSFLVVTWFSKLWFFDVQLSWHFYKSKRLAWRNNHIVMTTPLKTIQNSSCHYYQFKMIAINTWLSRSKLPTKPPRMVCFLLWKSEYFCWKCAKTIFYVAKFLLRIRFRYLLLTSVFIACTLGSGRMELNKEQVNYRLKFVQYRRPDDAMKRPETLK